jgi:chromosome segregation ATPase
MARGGVTFTEVDEATRYLQGLGYNPTMDTIREKLGTGSRTTLAEHLKRWKSLQADGEGRLPHPLLVLVTGLWESLQGSAEQRIAENTTQAHQELSTLKAQLQNTQQNEHQLRQQGHQLQALETTHEKINLLYLSTLKQLEDSRQENQRLHQLSAQIQKNLEHYQQTIQEQQLQQKMEKQQALVIQESTLTDLSSSQQAISLLRQEIAVFIHQLQQTQTDLHQAKDKIEALRQEKLFLIQKKSNLEGALNLLQNRKQGITHEFQSVTS